MDTTSTLPAPAAPAAPNAWTRRRRLLVGFTAVALVAGGGAAIAAGQPDTDTDGSATAAPVKPVPGKIAFGLGGVLHSQSVVSDGDGGFVTHLTQIGKIESLDADRLTVVSEDGYSRSWNRTSDTVMGGAGWSVDKNDDGSFTVKKDTGELAVGDQVLVVGTLSGDEATAARIAPRPDAAEIPGAILKRLEAGPGAELGDRGALKDHLRERFEMKAPGAMGGPGAQLRRFEFRIPDGAGDVVEAPAPATEEAPSASAVPAEPSSGTGSEF